MQSLKYISTITNMKQNMNIFFSNLATAKYGEPCTNFPIREHIELAPIEMVIIEDAKDGLISDEKVDWHFFYGVNIYIYSFFFFMVNSSKQSRE